MWGCWELRGRNASLCVFLGVRGPWVLRAPCRRVQPLGDGPEVTKSWEEETLNFLGSIQFPHSCKVFTELQFECGVISNSVFTVFWRKTRQTWKCICICWNGLYPGATLPLPLRAFGKVWRCFGGRGWALYRHLVGEATDACNYPTWHRMTPRYRGIWSQISTVPKLRSLDGYPAKSS